MKNVFTNRELPHVWAHQTQREGRNGNSTFYFDGDTIYSYGSHFPIARHVTNSRGEKAILFTTDDYSKTTASHKSAVHHAIPGHVDVFEVPLKDEVADQLSDYNRRIQQAEKSAAYARDEWKRNFNLSNAAQLHEQARKFARFFDLDESAIVELSTSLEELKAAVKAESTRKGQETKARRAAELARLKDDIERWRNGQQVYVNLRDVPTMLRIVGDEVETSMGARFPVSHAQNGLALVRAVMARGKEWKANGHSCHLGHYRIERITATGTVYAGCHVVEWAEIERISEQLDAEAMRGLDAAQLEARRRTAEFKKPHYVFQTTGCDKDEYVVTDKPITGYEPIYTAFEDGSELES